jgi:hypothetical protein
MQILSAVIKTDLTAVSSLLLPDSETNQATSFAPPASGQRRAARLEE